MSDQSEALRNAGFVEASRLHGKEIIQLRARIKEDESLMQIASHLLKRYVSETPLGNQPHMITMEADAAITALRKRLESSK